MEITLLLIGIFLIFFNVKAIGYEKVNFNTTFKSTKENLDESKIEIVNLRHDFAETIFELQKEIEDLKLQVNKLSGLNNNSHLNILLDDSSIEENDMDNEIMPVKKIEVDATYDSKDSTNSTSNNVKVKEIKDLFSLGKTVDEIAGILNIGKGEIQLVKDFYIK